MKNKGYAKFCGANKVQYGRCASGVWTITMTMKRLKSKHYTNHCQYILDIGIMTFSYSALKGQPSVHISSDKFSI